MNNIRQINANGILVRVLKVNDIDYISLTDLAMYANSKYPSAVIRNWMSNKDSFAFYSLWEEINNINFNSVESHIIKSDEVPYNRFTMTPNRWIKKFNSIGIVSFSGKYSIGTFAHPDIAFEFASWLSPEFKLYVITEFQRLKKKEHLDNNIVWEAGRLLTKINYVVQTDAVKNILIPTLNDKQKRYVYAEEADVLNVALFGMTAKEWKEHNKNSIGNIRDNANLLQLVILNNLENINSELIKLGIKQNDRLVRLNQIAKDQISLLNNNSLKNLTNKEN